MTLLSQWSERIAAAAVSGTRLCIRAGGTKDFYGNEPRGETFETRDWQGIESYEPSELVITARAGTPLAQIEAESAYDEITHGERLRRFTWHSATPAELLALPPVVVLVTTTEPPPPPLEPPKKPPKKPPPKPAPPLPPTMLWMAVPSPMRCVCAAIQ